MKIVDVNPFYYPYKGGIERRMHDTAARLAARGHDVTILTGKLSPDSPAEEKTEGFRIVRLDSRLLKIYNPPFISSKGVGEALESLDPDVVNFNYRWAPSYSKDLRRYDGAKVFTYHNMWGEGTGLVGAISKFNDSRFSKTLETFDHIIAVSDAVRDDLIRRGYPEKYVTTVPTCLTGGIDPGKGDGDFILSLGRLVKTKGLDVLMEAMKDVDHKLVVCGSGPEEKRLRKLISKYGLEDRVEMKGYVTDEERTALMGSCRFFVMPSLFESLGLAAEELMSRGRPVVCSDANGLPETVGKAGVVVPKGDAKALADAMNSLYDDGERCNELAEAAVERAKFYDWDNHLPVIEDIYVKAAAGELTEADGRSNS
jgi:glycosyltransferase involved in cell wall biosynthesis